MRKCLFAARVPAAIILCAAALSDALHPSAAAVLQSPAGWPARWQSDPAFEAVWSRTDAPVAAGLLERSWLWGPEPFAVGNEPYAESPTGLRLVEYLDKGRMELNDPAADRESPWFVTSGLLVREMVNGQIQTGASTFLTREPAHVQVTGDAQAVDTPAYADFAGRLERVQDRRGQVVGQRMEPDGTVSSVEPPGEVSLFRVREYDGITGHNVPAVFYDWARRSGPVYEDGLLVEAAVLDPLYVLGRPITDAYWVDTSIGGQQARVMVQLFERRTLTYNPANPPEWRVEMGNVGRAYFEWRYGASPPGPALAARSSGVGATIAGWNWPPGTSVSLRIELAGADTPISGPLEVTPDVSGYFSLVLPSSPVLNGATAAGANLRVVAQGAGGMVALPFRASPVAASGALEGMLSHVERDGAWLRLTLKGHDGAQQRLLASISADLRFADGGRAGTEAVLPGAYVAVRGSENAGTFQVARLDLLSVSSGGSAVGYVRADGNRLHVSGRGWPARQEVAFGTGAALGDHRRFGSLIADSRGNLAGTITLPSVTERSRTRLWISAGAAFSSGRARVLVPLWSLGTALDPATPQLFVFSASGGQGGAEAAVCPVDGCSPGQRYQLPAQALAAAPGEVLTLRPQWGADPLIATSPTRFSAGLYGLDGSVPGEFVQSGTLAHSTGDLPGRPLSVPVPDGIRPGNYVLLVSASWTSVNATLAYAFLLEVA